MTSLSKVNTGHNGCLNRLVTGNFSEAANKVLGFFAKDGHYT
jgi:Flp pilus assembly CpaF family ATPase